MNLIRHITLWILFIGIISHVHAQNAIDIKVKKQSPITREFVYQAKPVSPEALVDLFPPQLGNKNIDRVNLKNMHFYCQVDSSNWQFKDEKDYQKKRAYECSFFGTDFLVRKYNMDSTWAAFIGGYTGYILLGNTTGGKYIILAEINTGGRSQCYVFIFDINQDELIRLGYFYVPNLRDYTLEIKGNLIINGPNKYEIPVSAR